MLTCMQLATCIHLVNQVSLNAKISKLNTVILVLTGVLYCDSKAFRLSKFTYGLSHLTKGLLTYFVRANKKVYFYLFNNFIIYVFIFTEQNRTEICLDV